MQISPLTVLLRNNIERFSNIYNNIGCNITSLRTLIAMNTEDWRRMKLRRRRKDRKIRLMRRKVKEKLGLI